MYSYLYLLFLLSNNILSLVLFFLLLLVLLLFYLFGKKDSKGSTFADSTMHPKSPTETKETSRKTRVHKVRSLEFVHSWEQFGFYFNSNEKKGMQDRERRRRERG